MLARLRVIIPQAASSCAINPKGLESKTPGLFVVGEIPDLPGFFSCDARLQSPVPVRGPAQAVHDGDAEPGLAERFGDDCIEAGLIKQAHDKEQPDRRLGELAAAGAERFDALPVMEADIRPVVGTGITEQSVAFALFGLEIRGAI